MDSGPIVGHNSRAFKQTASLPGELVVVVVLVVFSF